jgi:hypothetical protein
MRLPDGTLFATLIVIGTHFVGQAVPRACGDADARWRAAGAAIDAKTVKKGLNQRLFTGTLFALKRA